MKLWALVKTKKSETIHGKENVVISIHADGRKFSEQEAALFAICEISSDCFSSDELKRLEAGRSLVLPFGSSMKPPLYVVDTAAIDRGKIEKTDLVKDDED